MNRMKLWCIAVVLIAALLLVGAAGAVKPVKEPVDKVVLIHYKDGVAAKPAPVLNAASYKLLGVKWKTTAPVEFYVDPSNNDKVAESAVTGEVADSFATWDAATSSKDLFSVRGAPVKGSQVAQNYENVVFWENMADSNIIAVTTYWVNRATKAFVETDIKMNDNDQYQMIWGIDPDGEGPTPLTNAYDIRNIATHEIGHVCGLGDLYGYSR